MDINIANQDGYSNKNVLPETGARITRSKKRLIEINQICDKNIKRTYSTRVKSKTVNNVGLGTEKRVNPLSNSDVASNMETVTRMINSFSSNDEDSAIFDNVDGPRKKPRRKNLENEQEYPKFPEAESEVNAELAPTKHTALTDISDTVSTTSHYRNNNSRNSFTSDDEINLAYKDIEGSTQKRLRKAPTDKTVETQVNVEISATIHSKSSDVFSGSISDADESYEIVNPNNYSFKSTETDSGEEELVNTKIIDKNSPSENNYKAKRRYTWISEPKKSLEDALQFLASEGFVQFDRKVQTTRVKLYFRCSKVTKTNKTWCDLRYNAIIPDNENIVYIENNGAEHTHDTVISKVRKFLSGEMVQFLHDLYANKTTSYESVIRHINSARSSRNLFEDEDNPRYRQHEYQLKKFRNAELKPVVSIGDIAAFCEENLIYPQSENNHFVLNCETSTVGEGMFFRFCMSTPYLLSQFAQISTICIDATYKLNWMGFPMVVMGTVDRAKRFHPLLYGCSTNETADDYAFYFNSVKDGVKKNLGNEWNAEILICDGAIAIRNGFYRIFPNALLDIMCYAHVIRNIRKRQFSSKNNKQLILDDIQYLQLAANRKEFDAMCKLFLKKWEKIETDFIQYFKREWLTSRCNWFEGAADYTPSTNNALESHNANIKRNWTFRKRLPMNQFFVAMIEMTVAASQKLSSGDQKIATEPTISKKMMMKGVELEVNQLKAFKSKETDEDLIIFLVPSDNCGNPTRQYYKQIQQKIWKSFDEYIEYGFNQFYIVHLSKTDWNTKSRCTCPSYFKQYVCKHIIATAIREKMLEVTPSMNPTLLTKVKQRGRPKGALRALMIQ